MAAPLAFGTLSRSCCVRGGLVRVWEALSHVVAWCAPSHLRPLADPEKSRVKEGQMTTFISGELEQDIESVPGIGPAAAALLAKVGGCAVPPHSLRCVLRAHVCSFPRCHLVMTQKGVNNTYQLFGVFLGLCETGAFVLCRACVVFCVSVGGGWPCCVRRVVFTWLATHDRFHRATTL